MVYPGRNNVYRLPPWARFLSSSTDGVLFFGPQTNAVTVTFAFMLLPEAIYLALVEPAAAANNAYVTTIVVPLLIVASYYFFLRASASDPGVIPRCRPDWELDAESDLGYLSDNASSRPSSKQYVYSQGRRFVFTFCNKCQAYRKGRSPVHCTACGNCVVGFDHHCPYIGTCVGSASYPYFFGFLFFGTAADLAMMASCLVRLLRLTYSPVRANLVSLSLSLVSL